jgi:hypothetical protein
MNLDDLKEPWKQRHSELMDSRVEELTARVLTRASAFEKTILRRDLIETAAAMVVIVFFGLFMTQSSLPWVARLGIGLIILGAIEVVVVLHWTRRRGGRTRHDLPLIDYCAAEITRIDRQIWLLRNVNWWYTGPLLLGACVFVFGLLFPVHDVLLPISLAAFVMFCVLVLIFGWIAYRINQRAVRHELLPIREELATIFDSLRDNSPASGDAKIRIIDS